MYGRSQRRCRTLQLGLDNQFLLNILSLQVVAVVVTIIRLMQVAAAVQVDIDPQYKVKAVVVVEAPKVFLQRLLVHSIQ